MRTQTSARTDALIQALDEQLDNAFKFSNEKQDGKILAAHKTVATFSTLLGRKLWLKPSPTGGYTDGYEIGAPYDDKYFYQIVEHEIAHNLFKSNFKAKELFSDAYTTQIQNALETNGRKISSQSLYHLKECIGTLVNVVEDHRIHSLWSLLYPGSYALLIRYGQELIGSERDALHENLIRYFLAVAYDVPDLPPGKLDRLRPAMVAALKKTERKGPEATFIVCKWLITQLVSELIRDLQGEPPPPDAGNARISTDLDNASFQPSPQGQGQGQSDEGQTGADSAPQSDDKTSGAASAQPQPQGAAQANDGGAWQPPQVQASVDDRLNALEQLIQLAQDTRRLSPNEQQLRTHIADVKKNRHSTGEKRVESMIKDVLNTDVNHPTLLKRMLDSSESKMAQTVKELEKALETVDAMLEDDWITRDAGAPVVLVDVEHPSHYLTPMRPEDQRYATQLKQMFARVHARASKQLSDSGAEIDIEAVVSNRMNRTLDPVFKQEASGRGFKALVLVDRSGSMAGERTHQVDRASKVLRTALDLPYVHYETWGFQSDNSGKVILTRVPKQIDVEGTMKADGQTPLHIALRTAVNYLGTGTERKHLIVLTDGEPCYSHGSGRTATEKTLTLQVGKETMRARKMGVNVSALAIGDAVGPKRMRTMFGGEPNWKIVENKRVSSSLVQLISRAFLNYLKHG